MSNDLGQSGTDNPAWWLLTCAPAKIRNTVATASAAPNRRRAGLTWAVGASWGNTIAPGRPGAMVFPQDAPTAHVSPARRRFGAALAVATVFLIFAGAQVKSHQAGLSVPDWPKSFDMWWPPMVGNVFYEHGHRVIAATVGFLTLLMALWTWRAESRASVRRLAWCC